MFWEVYIRMGPLGPKLGDSNVPWPNLRFCVFILNILLNFMINLKLLLLWSNKLCWQVKLSHGCISNWFISVMIVLFVLEATIHHQMGYSLSIILQMYSYCLCFPIGSTARHVCCNNLLFCLTIQLTWHRINLGITSKCKK